ncbi:MAG: DNA repair protein RadC, partial [Oscillospiraceae bacterium]|nr:DNA repair protein RadC [Oscillospiraceae bacterium]
MHEGHRARVKERFKQDGLDSFAPHEVLELLLFFAIPQRNVNPLAHALIEHFGSLAGVLEASPEDLCNCAGVGDNAATLLSMVPQLSAYYARNKFGPRPALPNVAAAGAYCQTLFVGAVREMLYLICLDTQKRVIQPTLIQKGTLDETPVYPRDVVAAALRSHAHAVVLAHNHPSGALLPSTSDYETTRMIISALGAVQIPVLD